MKELLKKITFILFFLISGFVVQAHPNLDSLWIVWDDETSPDTSRAKALSRISMDGYLYSQPDSAFYFAQVLYDFANKRGLKKEMAQALKMQGATYYIKSDYSKAIDYFERSLAISIEISDKSGIAGSLNNIGIIFRKKGYYPKALDYYQQSLKIMEEISDKSGMADILNNIGVICEDKGDYSKAMDYYKRAFEIHEELSNLSGMADALNNIGIIYKYLGDYPKAMDYYQRSLNIKKDLSGKIGIANVLNNMGEIYMEQGDYFNAMDYYQRSFKIKEEITDRKGMASTMNNMGMIYNKQAHYKKAIDYCKKGLRISNEMNILEEKKNACKCLFDAYKSLGNDKLALKFHERVSILDDSLQFIETTKKLQEMEFARQIFADSLAREKEKLKIQMAHEAEVRKKNRTRNIYIAAALLLLIFAVGFHRRMVYMRRAKTAIEKAKNLSDKLLLNILPSEIAEELKLKGKADSRKFDMVTILFTDFKEFTQISEKLSAEELVEEINSCFKSFDTICIKYGIEKIKTIGDSYMAAGGLPVPSNDSVINTVLAGIEMAEYIINKKQKSKTEGNICFDMRVGIHTGPVIAGIVGVTKFQYDIWGDAVNTASRMENAGEVSKINISQSTYELIKEDPAFKFMSRGKINVKGKGDIEMYFVEKVS